MSASTLKSKAGMSPLTTCFESACKSLQGAVAVHAACRTCCVVKRTYTAASSAPGNRIASLILSADSCGMTVAGMMSGKSHSLPLHVRETS